MSGLLEMQPTRRLIGTLIVMTACSGATSDTDETAEPTMPGAITVHNTPRSLSGAGQTFSTVEFQAVLGACPVVAPGSCRLNPCSYGPPWVSAGTITISGTESPLVFTPDTEKQYSEQVQKAPAFSGGEKLVVTSTGDDVPAFSTSLLAPELLTITTPVKPTSSLSVDRYQDFAVSWSGGSGAVLVRFINAGNTTTGHVDYLECAFLAESGSGIVPSSELLLLRSCTDPAYCFVEMSSLSDVRVTAGTWGVLVDVRHVAVWPDNTVVRVGNVLE
jgi:hypothetical protein